MSELIELITIIIKKPIAKLVLIIIGLIIIGSIVYSIVYSVPRLSATQINTIGSTGVIDNEIISYNGLSFYSINPSSDSKPNIVFTPNYRLPVPDKIFWGNKDGALIRFSSGFNYSPVEDYINSNDMTFTNQYSILWYLSFTDGSLTPVDNTPDPINLVLFNSKDNNFYYIINESGEENINELKVFDTSKKSTSALNAQVPYQILSLAECSTDGSVLCAISYTNNGKKALYSVNNSGDFNREMEAIGQIIPTLDPSTFITLEDPQINDVDTTYKKLSTVNITDGKKIDYSTNEIGDSSFISGIVNKSNYLLTDDGSRYLYLQSNLFNMKSVKNGIIDLGDPILTDSSLINKDFAIVKSTISGDNYLLTAKKINQKFSKISDDVFRETINQCLTKEGVAENYAIDEQIITIFIDDSSYQTKVGSVQDCLSKTPEIMLGHEYKFRGISSENGRVTTD